MTNPLSKLSFLLSLVFGRLLFLACMERFSHSTCRCRHYTFLASSAHYRNSPFNLIGLFHVAGQMSLRAARGKSAGNAKDYGFLAGAQLA